MVGEDQIENFVVVGAALLLHGSGIITYDPDLDTRAIHWENSKTLPTMTCGSSSLNRNGHAKLGGSSPPLMGSLSR